jgi:tetratricopeptide (TPR) repeat protein
MRAIFNHSWALLAEQERQLFTQLSVFRGGFDVRAAQAVARASLPELRSLINKSFLQRTPTGRYEIHELLRQFGAERLAEQRPVALAPARPEESLAVWNVRNRHSAYYCAFLQEREERLKGAGQQLALHELEVEAENIRLAWQWAIETEQIEPLDQAAESLGLFYLWRGRYSEGETAFRLAAAKLDLRESGNKSRVLAKLLTWQAVFIRIQGNLELAGQLLQQSLTLLNDPNLVNSATQAEKAAILLEMGNVAVETDNVEADRLYRQSLVLYQALADQWAIAEVLSHLGEASRGLGDYGEARQRQEEALRIRRALGDQRGIAVSLRKLSDIAMNRGEFEMAEQWIRESFTIREEIGDQVGIADSLFELGMIHSFFGNFSEAHSILEKTLAICIDLGHVNLIHTRIFLGVQKLHLGQYEQAQAQLQTDLVLCREVNNRYQLGNALRTLGRSLLAQAAYTEAEDRLQESVTVFQELHQPADMAQAFGFLAYVAHGLGYTSKMRHYLVRTLQMAIETGDILPLVFTLPAVALFFADQGQPEQAVEIYTLVSPRPVIANSRFFEDIASRRLAAIAATLPPEVAAAAQARGQARDLWAAAKELLEELSE